MAASAISLRAACLRARAGKLEALKHGLASGRRGDFQGNSGDIIPISHDARLSERPDFRIPDRGQ